MYPLLRLSILRSRKERSYIKFQLKNLKTNKDYVRLVSMKPSYFVVALSNRENLDLCEKYALAGFPNSISGLWAFVDIKENDFISFLYAARLKNLYRVIRKKALEEAEKLPPWKPLKFRSGRTYFFPFRLELEPLRKFEEPLIRTEFAYIAENLLLRGGYAKTHFQADQTTLQSASQIGELYKNGQQKLLLKEEKLFTPLFVIKKEKEKLRPPYIWPFHETILQALLRHYLSDSAKLRKFLSEIGVHEHSSPDFEVLGEKALPQGHVDILIKEAVPIGIAKKILVEVKLGQARLRDLIQLRNYQTEFGAE